MKLHDLSVEQQDMMILLEEKSETVLRRMQGFSGSILFLDNGEWRTPRYTAVKFPKKNSKLTDAEIAKRFIREIKLQADMHYHFNVHYPHTLKLILGTPVAYYRMWRGVMSDYIYDKTMSIDGKLAIMAQIANGLLHCSNRGVTCHQDLKPENILIMSPVDACGSAWPEAEPTLVPKIADFGSVDLFKEVNELRGTRPYMAPEQWGNGTLSDKTHMFALGVMLYEFISGGQHPIGCSSENWRLGCKPDFNRWQKNTLWRRWHSNGSPIENPLEHADIQNLVSDCMSTAPHQRPSLEDFIARVLDAILARSEARHDQTTLFINFWNQNSSTSSDWAHLNSQIFNLQREINSYYGNDRHRTTAKPRC